VSHWAEVNNDNQVIRVLVGDNNDPAGDEGYSWLIDNLGGTWIKTSYNSTIRGNYAGIGYTYLPLEDIFMPPKCHAEAVLNAKSAKWECTNEDHDIKEMPLA
jgi:hypothetical protein